MSVPAKRQSMYELVFEMEKAGAFQDTDLVLPADMPDERFEALGAFLGKGSEKFNWYLAAWVVSGEETRGDRFAQMAEATGKSPQTLMNLSSVYRRVPQSRRRAALTFSHHAEVAALEPKEQKRWLAEAEKGGWTRAVMREHMKPSAKSKPPLREVALAILRDAELADDGQSYLVPTETIARLKAALGEEE